MEQDKKPVIKGARLIIGFVICFFAMFSLICLGFHGPFVARFAYSKIKIGMTKNEAMSVLSKYGRVVPRSDISIWGEPSGESIRVMFIGPMFVATTFHVNLNNDERVESITPLHSFD